MARSLFDLLIRLPPVDAPDWLEAQKRLTEKRAARAVRRRNRAQAELDRKQRAAVKRGKALARNTLAKAGDPFGAERAAALVAAMRVGEWYALEDMARVTGTWPAWVRSAARSARANGWLEGAGKARQGTPALYRLSDRGAAAKAAH